MTTFVDDEGSRAGWKDLEGLEELDEGVALVWRKGVEGLALGKGFAVVGFDGFAGGGEFSVMHKSAAMVVEAPEFASEEFTVSRKESHRARRLVLVQWLAFGVALRVAGGADVVELEVRVGRNHDDALGIWLEARGGKLFAGEVDRKRGSCVGIICWAKAQVG